MATGFPVGAAQKKVLEALNLKASDFADAERIFEDCGIIVTSKRGTPEIRLASAMVGGWIGSSRDGDGDATAARCKKIDLAKVAQWIIK